MINTVSDLIEELKKLPQDAHVTIPVDSCCEYVWGVKLEDYDNCANQFCIIYSDSQADDYEEKE